MKVWTYLEMSNKVLTDLDLMDETFINPVELVGYFNEAVDEAESEINTLPLCDYFKTYASLPIISGVSQYRMPPDIYINKIRGMLYTNGSIIYPIVKFKPRFEFEDMAFTDQYGQSDDYRYVLVNPSPGQTRIEFHPASRDTAISPPRYAYPDSVNPQFGGSFPNLFTPVKVWYIRHAQRLPLPTFNNVTGETTTSESMVCSLTGSSFSSVNTGTNTISLVRGLTHADGYTPYVPGGIAYVTGDCVYFTPSPGAVLPSPLVQGTPYYIIATGTSGVYQLASSLANALANLPITLTTSGTGFVDVTVVVTQNILNALLVDIPQFANFILAWVKARCLDKDGDPRLIRQEQMVTQQRKQMVDTLAEMVPDLDNEIEPDFSSYQEMS
jgi:hypothetical protein